MGYIFQYLVFRFTIIDHKPQTLPVIFTVIVYKHVKMNFLLYIFFISSILTAVICLIYCSRFEEVFFICIYLLKYYDTSSSHRRELHNNVLGKIQVDLLNPPNVHIYISMFLKIITYYFVKLLNILSIHFILGYFCWVKCIL